eukprot:gene5336-biopygen9816
MVIESSGGAWGPIARKVWSLIATASAKISGVPSSQKAEEIAQTLSVILHRANALSVLRRFPCAEHLPPSAQTRAAATIERSEAARLAAMPADCP